MEKRLKLETDSQINPPKVFVNVRKKQILVFWIHFCR